MPIDTGIPLTVRRPQVMHRLIFQQGGSVARQLPQSVLFIGAMKGGIAVANAIYPITTTDDSATLFGLGTEADLMVKAGFAYTRTKGFGPAFFACGVAEPGGGAAATFTLTAASNAASGGTWVVRIAGRTYRVGVAQNDTPTTVAANLLTLINADTANLPVTATVAAGVITLTYRTKGVNGNDVRVEVVPTTTQPNTQTLVAAAGVVGSGVTALATALANSTARDYDAVAIANHAAQDVTDALANIAVCWTPTAKKWREIVIGENGTLGVATALAANGQAKELAYISMAKCRSLPCEMAASATAALQSKNRPNANWDGEVLPLYPCDEADNYNGDQVEAALAAGITPLTLVVDANSRAARAGVVQIEKFVTGATTLNGAPSEVTRDIAVPRTAAWWARQIDVGYKARFGPEANPDGTLQDDDTLIRIRAFFTALYGDAAERKILKSIDTDLALLQLEPDIDSPGRTNVDSTIHPVIGQHQLAVISRVTVGGN